MAVKTTLKVLSVGALVVAAGLLAWEVFYWMTHVYEDDARVQTDLTNISAQVDGKIAEILVPEGGSVEKGQPLIRLVDDDVAKNIDALDTDLSLERARRARLVSEKEAFEIDLFSRLATQREKIRAIEVTHASLSARLKLAEKNLARVQYLYKRKLKPEDQLTLEQDKVLVLRGEEARLAAERQVARKELEQFAAASKQIQVIEEKIKISDIEQARIADAIAKQRIELGYRRIGSPINGTVGRVLRFAGEYVEDGVPILMLHDPDLYWIEARVDEDQIRHVKVGQEVLIDLDAYPFDDFYGQVVRIGSVTAGRMGIDAGGRNGVSFGGNSERVPVRISVRNPPPNIAPGMRADVNIRIYEDIKLW